MLIFLLLNCEWENLYHTYASNLFYMQAAAIDCLTVALSVSPPSVEIKDMLLEEASGGQLVFLN